MAPAKKQKISKDRSFKDFLLVLRTLSNDYEAVGCHCKAENLRKEISALDSYAWVRKCSHQPLTDTKQFENSDAGSNILDMMDEFIKTGKCEARDELLSVKQVPLVRPALSLGVFREIDIDVKRYETCMKCSEKAEYCKECDDKAVFHLFLYETADKYKRPLYTDFFDYAVEPGLGWALEECHGLDRIQVQYDYLEMFEFVGKANPGDREDAKTFAFKGDADMNWRWQSGEDEITPDELRDLVRSGKYELKYHDALEQLHREEKQFLKNAKYGLREAIDNYFPYEDVTWQHGRGFDLLATGE